MKIEDIKEMVDKHKSPTKTLIINDDTYFQFRDEIDSLGINFITSERLPKDVKAVVIDRDIFDSMYYLEKGSDNNV